VVTRSSRISTPLVSLGGDSGNCCHIGRGFVSSLAYRAVAARYLSRANNEESPYAPYPFRTAAQPDRRRAGGDSDCHALAVLVNAVYIVKQRIDKVGRPTGWI